MSCGHRRFSAAFWGAQRVPEVTNTRRAHVGVTVFSITMTLSNLKMDTTVCPLRSGGTPSGVVQVAAESNGIGGGLCIAQGVSRRSSSIDSRLLCGATQGFWNLFCFGSFCWKVHSIFGACCLDVRTLFFAN